MQAPERTNGRATEEEVLRPGEGRVNREEILWRGKSRAPEEEEVLRPGEYGELVAQCSILVAVGSIVVWLVAA